MAHHNHLAPSPKFRSSVRHCFMQKFVKATTQNKTVCPLQAPFQSVVPSFLIVGTSLPALIVLVIAADRFVAVLKPAKYRMYAGPRLKLASALVILAFQLVLPDTTRVSKCATFKAFVLLAAIPAMEGGGCKNARWCTIITSTSDLYALFHFAFITVAHAVGFSSMLLLLRLTKVGTHIRMANRDKRLIVCRTAPRSLWCRKNMTKNRGLRFLFFCIFSPF